jgi:hypothetical protein
MTFVVESCACAGALQYTAMKLASVKVKTTLCTDIIFVELQNYSTHLQSIVTYATLLHYYTVYIFSHLTSRFTHIHNSHFVFIVMCILVYGN